MKTNIGPYNAINLPGSPRRASRVVLIVVCIAAFMAALDVTIVNVALPTIQADLGGSIAGLQWVGAGYALTFGSLLLTGGALSDRYGARNAFLAGVALFVMGSTACALSTALLGLNLSRIIQGSGAALTVPSTLALLREAYPNRHERARAIALYAASGGIAQVAGPVLGGVLVATVGWRSIFMVNVPIGAFVMAATVLKISASRASHSRNLDIVGQFTAVIWLVLLAAALIDGGQRGWTSPVILTAIGLSFIAFLIFVVVERRTREPMLPLAELGNPHVAALLGIAIILGFAYFGQFFVLAIFFQEAWGASPVGAGFAFLPMTIGVTAANLMVGPRVGRIGARTPMVCGQALCALGYLVLSGIDAKTGYLLIGVLFLAIGVGGGLIVPAMTAAMLDVVGQERSGIASGVLNAGRQMGSVVGIALFGSLVAQSGLVTGLHQALIIAALSMVAGGCLSLIHGRRSGTSICPGTRQQGEPSNTQRSP